MPCCALVRVRYPVGCVPLGTHPVLVLPGVCSQPALNGEMGIGTQPELGGALNTKLTLCPSAAGGETDTVCGVWFCLAQPGAPGRAPRLWDTELSQPRTPSDSPRVVFVSHVLPQPVPVELSM